MKVLMISILGLALCGPVLADSPRHGHDGDRFDRRHADHGARYDRGRDRHYGRRHNRRNSRHHRRSFDRHHRAYRHYRHGHGRYRAYRYPYYGGRYRDGYLALSYLDRYAGQISIRIPIY
ncbi:MAG: hypothetical protein O6931_00520 [Gammaproteobacteria bacterium]|nr:hypothetical protein [Gammaproteobacteria bacterium]